ncbi:MAG: ArnT family glycosyltransferase [Candidatus Binatia bacterium]
MASDPLVERGRPSGFARFLLALVAVGLLVIVATWRDYGITWDESVQARYGDLVLDYFASGLRDTRCNEFRNLRFYAPLADLVGAAAVRWTGGDAFTVRHFVIALSGLSAVVGAALFARLAGGAWSGVLAALALATMPRFYGNSFHNPKDIPFAAAFTWAMLALAAWLASPRPRRWRALLTGGAFGVALAIRPGAFPLLVALLVAAVAWSVALPPAHADHPEDSARPGPWRRALRLGPDAALVLVVAWMGMIAPWPWAHEAVLRHPWRAMREAANFSMSFPVLFGGQVHQSNQLPWTYVPTYLVITTPPAVLALTVAGLAVTFLRWRSGDGHHARWIAAAWALLPVAAVVALRPNLYDGIRHLLFVVPAIAVLAGVGGACLADSVPGERARRFARAALVLAMLAPAWSLYRLHPYQGTYFNVFVGGLAGAATSYETDYWTSSYKEAVEWVNSRPVPDGAKLRILVVANDYNRPCAEAYLAPHVSMESLWGRTDEAAIPPGFDYSISTTRYRADEMFPESPVVHVVGRNGAAFSVIRAGKKKEPPPP